MASSSSPGFRTPSSSQHGKSSGKQSKRLSPVARSSPANGSIASSSPLHANGQLASPMMLESSKGSLPSLPRSPSQGTRHSPSKHDRPHPKRRKTAPELFTSPETPPIIIKSPYERAERKGNQDVWFGAVEDAFLEAIRVIPMLGRRKVIVDDKQRGRNELIAEYIFNKTGLVRTRKQVSSHVQVFKNLNKGNPELMALVSEPGNDDDEDEEAESPRAPNFGARLPAPLAEPATLAVPMKQSRSNDGLLSPYAPSFMYRSPSVASSASSRSVSPMPSPLLSPAPSPSPLSMSSAAMFAAHSLIDAMEGMSLPDGRSVEDAPCVIGLSHFAMWAGDKDKKHVFTRMNRRGLAKGLGTTRMESLADFELRYPGLSNARDRLPCQFLHATVELDIPSGNMDPSFNQISTKLQVTSLQKLNLSVVTTIYSFGTVVLSLQEDLPDAWPLEIELDAVSGAPLRTPSNPYGHLYAYRVPFASDFWTIFFGGSGESDQPAPSFSKSGAERSEFDMAIGGLSVVQEFVVRSPGEEPNAAFALENIALVVTYDLQCRTDETTCTNVSFLAPLASPGPSVVPLDAEVAPLGMAFVDERPPSAAPKKAARANGRPAQAPNGRRAGGHRPSGSIGNKLNLSLEIPPVPTSFASLGGGGGMSPGSRALNPITPLPQVLHTPLSPPPMPAVPSQAQTERLQKIWAENSSAWGMDSPVLLGTFPHSSADMSSSHMAPDRPPSSGAVAPGTTSLAGYNAIEKANLVMSTSPLTMSEINVHVSRGGSVSMTNSPIVDKHASSSAARPEDYFDRILGSSTKYSSSSSTAPPRA